MGTGESKAPVAKGTAEYGDSNTLRYPAETAAGMEWSWESSFVPCRGKAGEVGQAKSVGTQKIVRPQTWSSTSRLWFVLNLIFYALVLLFGNRKGCISDFTQVTS